MNPKNKQSLAGSKECLRVIRERLLHIRILLSTEIYPLNYTGYNKNFTLNDEFRCLKEIKLVLNR